MDESQFPVYNVIRHIVTDEIEKIAIPLFFFISGFLFFYRSEFSFATYGLKLKRRIRTLLIPYLFWNMVVLLYKFLTQTFFLSMTSGRNKLISDFNWLDWLNVFWNHYEGNPICYQFWFIRNQYLKEKHFLRNDYLVSAMWICKMFIKYFSTFDRILCMIIGYILISGIESFMTISGEIFVMYSVIFSRYECYR